MWQLKKIIIKNFLSILNAEFDFVRNKTTMIQGRNLDDEGQESNGSGKSAFIESIYFALVGDSFRKVKILDLIKNDENYAEIGITIVNSFNNETLHITRKIDRKSPQSVTILFNGAKKVLSSTNSYNEFIIEKIGISKEDISNYFIISKDSYSSFLLSTDSVKKAIISRFSNINILDGIEKIIISDIAIIDKQIQEYEIKKSRLEGNIENVEQKEQFDERIANLTNSVVEKIAQKKEQIADIDNSIIDVEKSLKQAEIKIAQLEVNFHSIELKNIEKSEQKTNEILSELKNNLEDYKEIQVEIHKNLKGVVECPNCSHEFSVTNSDFNVPESRIVLKSLDIEINKLSVDFDSQKQKMNELLSQKRQIDLKIREVQKEKNNCENLVQTLHTKIKNYRSDKKQRENAIIDYQKEIEFLKTNVYKKIDTSHIENEIIEILKIRNNLLDEKQNISELINHFKKFRTHLSNKTIYSIEKLTNMFLEKIKSNLSLKLEGYKLLANGNLKDNISVEVLRNGMFEGIIQKFSGGEKVRIDVCNILALQKLINANSKSGGLDLLILDEIIESVDSSGLYEILNQLNTIGQTIYVITHANYIKNFENILTIEKKNKNSKIIIS